MVWSSSFDPDMVDKCIKCLINQPDLKVPQAMKLTNFSVEKVANLSLRHSIQQSLPGNMLESLKVHTLLSLPLRPDRAGQLGNRAIDDEDAHVIERGSHACAIAMTSSSLLPWPPPAAMPQSWPSLSAASTALA